MKKLRPYLLILAGLAFLGALSSLDRSYLDHQNFLTNPGFESGKAAWSNSGSGTFSTDTSNVHGGSLSGKMTTSSNTGCIYQDVTPNPQTAGQNLEYSAWVKTTGTDVQVCARQAGATVGQCTAVPSTGKWVQAIVNYPGPSSGSVGVSVCNTANNTETFNVDDGYVGQARNLSQVSQAQLIGQVKITGCSAAWSTTSTSLAAFSAQTGCTYTVTAGSASAPATNIPGITFASLPPGNYTLKYEGTLQESYSTSAGSGSYQFWDGANTANELSAANDSSSTISPPTSPGIQQTISYSSPQSNVTLSIRGATSNAGSSALIFGTTANPGVISVYYYPSQSQLAVNSNSTPANWSGSSSLMGSTTSTSVTDPGSISGAVSTTASQNLSCTANGTYLGINCTLPTTGLYQICYGGAAASSSTNFVAQSELTDGSNTAITGFQWGTAGSANQGVPIGQCANYNATSTSATFKLRGYIGSAGTATFWVTSWSVTSLNTPMAAPILVGSVTSSGSGQYHTESASFAGNSSGTTACTSDPCVYVTGSGTGSGWASAVNWNGTGLYTIHFTAGEFSSPPTCFLQSMTITGDTHGVTQAGVFPSTSSWAFAFNNDSAVKTNEGFSITCMGPH